MKKLLLIVVVGILIVGIPITLYLAQQQQNVRQDAFVNNQFLPQAAGSCTYIQLIEGVEEPACRDLNATGQNSVSTYKVRWKIQNTSDQMHTVGWIAHKFWCTNPYTSSCADLSTKQTETGTVTISPNQIIEVPITRSTPSGAACGSFQIDFGLTSVDGNTSCNNLGGPSEYRHAVGALCETGIAQCAAAPTVTPTGTLTPTLTPTTTLIPTATPTTNPSCPVPDAVKNVKVNCPNCSI